MLIDGNIMRLPITDVRLWQYTLYREKLGGQTVAVMVDGRNDALIAEMAFVCSTLRS